MASVLSRTRAPGRRPQPSRRVVALDGLRGIAALVVVAHHSMLTIPAVADAFAGTDPRHDVAWALTFTPLHLFWSGLEFVAVFFVLSGFVLAGPFLDRMTAPGLAAYYVQRMARLYLPIWIAVAVAVVIVHIVARPVLRDASWWMNRHAVAPDVDAIAHDLVVVGKTNFINSALWTLGYEILFSLLLPVYVLVVRYSRRLPALPKIVACAAMSGAGAAIGTDGIVAGCVTYLPMFMVGAIVASDRDRFTAWVSARPARQGWGLFAVTLLLLDVRWYVAPFDSRVLAALATGVEVLTVAMLVLLFLAWSPARRAGSSPPIRWLGSRSFSLYLVHEPIVVSTAVLLGPSRTGFTLLIAAPVSLLAAELFYRLFERRTHRLARRWGAAVSARLAQGDPGPPGAASGGPPAGAEGTAAVAAGGRGAVVR